MPQYRDLFQAAKQAQRQNEATRALQDGIVADMTEAAVEAADANVERIGHNS